MAPTRDHHDSRFARRLLAIKATLTLLLLAAAGVYFGWQALTDRLGAEDGEILFTWTGDYLWMTTVAPRLFLSATAAVVILLVLTGCWPRRLTPRSLAGRIVALTAAVSCALALVVMQSLHVGQPTWLLALLIVAIGGAAAYYLGARPHDRPWLQRLGDALQRPIRRRETLALVVFLAALYLFAWHEIFNRQPIMTDSQSQISQARLLLTGRCTLDVRREFRNVIAFPYAVYDVPSFSQFPPGHVLLLAPFLRVGLPPQALNMVAGIVTILLIGSLARRLEGPAVARAACLMLVASPLMMQMSVSAMNHATACLMLWLAAWCLLPMAESGDGAARPGLAWSFVAGLALGWAVMTRPLTGLAHSLVWGGLWLALMAEAIWRRPPGGESPRRLLARLAAVVAGLVPPALIFMFFNWRTTGHPLMMGYEISNPMLHRLGFYVSAPDGRVYTPLEAIHRLAADMMALNRQMLGLAIGSWTLLLAWWLNTRLPRRHVVPALILLVQIFLYRLYQYHDLFFGPRFLFEALPALGLLAATGLAPLLRTGGMKAGATVLLLALLTIGAIIEGIIDGNARFYRIAGDHVRVERFVSQVLPSSGRACWLCRRATRK